MPFTTICMYAIKVVCKELEHFTDSRGMFKAETQTHLCLQFRFLFRQQVTFSLIISSICQQLETQTKHTINEQKIQTAYVYTPLKTKQPAKEGAVLTCSWSTRGNHFLAFHQWKDTCCYQHYYPNYR